MVRLTRKFQPRLQQENFVKTHHYRTMIVIRESSFGKLVNQMGGQLFSLPSPNDRHCAFKFMG